MLTKLVGLMVLVIGVGLTLYIGARFGVVQWVSLMSVQHPILIGFSLLMSGWAGLMLYRVTDKW